MGKTNEGAGVSSSCYLSNIATSKTRMDGIPDDNSESPRTMVVEQWKATQKAAHPRTKNKVEIVSCWCRRAFTSVKGLRIHQARKKCLGSRTSSRTEVQQCSGTEQSEPCETTEKSSQEESHCAARLNAQHSVDGTPRHPNVKWPPMKDSKAWAEMDDDIDLILKNMVFMSTNIGLKV